VARGGHLEKECQAHVARPPAGGSAFKRTIIAMNMLTDVSGTMSTPSGNPRGYWRFRPDYSAVLILRAHACIRSLSAAVSFGLIPYGWNRLSFASPVPVRPSRFPLPTRHQGARTTRSAVRSRPGVLRAGRR